MLVLAYFSGLEILISDICVYLLKRGIIYKIHIIMNSTLKQLLKFKAIFTKEKIERINSDQIHFNGDCLKILEL